MKKSIALILALCMVLSLAACGGSSNNAPAAKLNRGTINGDTYTNQYFDLSFKLPSGWTFYGDEDTAAMSGLKPEDINADDLTTLVDEKKQVMVCYAYSGTGTSVNILITSDMKAIVKYSDEEMFKMVMEDMKAQFAEQGIELVHTEIQKAKLFGEEKAVLKMDINYMGLTINEYQFWVRPSSGYGACITLAGVGLYDPADLYAAFGKAK